MDMYGHGAAAAAAAQELFGIDDLLDFSNDDLFSSSSAVVDSTFSPPLPTTADNSSIYGAATATATAVHYSNSSNFNSSSDFTADDLCVPSDDVAELEWLSQFVDDSFADFPADEFPAGAVNFLPESSFHGRSRSKRTRPAASTNTAWISRSPQSDTRTTSAGTSKTNGGGARKKESSLMAIVGDQSSSSSSTSPSSGSRRCAHCASEKTPQWRTGPLGPKTLCNACGVRYKSGRLVPEYRPAASPTFVLTQHSNSHRKVMELRRQKEVLREGQEQHQQQQQQFYHHHHHQNFEVC